MKLYKYISDIFKKMTNKEYFNIIYPLIIAVISLFGWQYSNMVGFISLITIALIFLFFTRDFNYIIPELLFFIFIISNGFTNDSFPIPLIIYVSIFIISLLAFVFYKQIKHRFNFNSMKSFIGLSLLAIINLIPIFWSNIPDGNEVFYFFFFGNLGYLLIYFLVSNGLQKTNISLLIESFIFMGLIVSVETFLKIWEIKDQYENIFSAYFHYGWGLCNEGGIIICFAMPFLFYKMYSSVKISNHIFNLCSFIILICGVGLTTSRGSYLCMVLELFLLTPILFFMGKDKKFHRYLIAVGTIFGISLFLGLNQYTFKFIKEIIDGVFYNGLDNNGRIKIWIDVIEKTKKSPLNMILGPGVCSILDERQSGVNGDFVTQLVPVVSHSTIFQTLLMGGIVGIIALGFHFYQKYKIMFKEGLPFFLTIGLGMLALDLYGMIDNTYHMYYYMIPLCVLLAGMDKMEFVKREPNDITELNQ